MGKPYTIDSAGRAGYLWQYMCGSNAKINFKGFGAEVYIGKNVRLPKNGLSVKTDCIIHIGDGVRLETDGLGQVGIVVLKLEKIVCFHGEYHY